MNRMSIRGLNACRTVKGSQRWGQAICNQYALKGELSDKLFYERDENKVALIVKQMIKDYQLD